MPAEFTIPDLRRVYEAIWGVELHPANFHRKVRSTEGFVTLISDGGGRGRAQRFARGPATSMMPPLMRPSATDPRRPGQAGNGARVQSLT